MKRSEMICKNCIFALDSGGELILECHRRLIMADHKWKWVESDEWCGDGEWREYRKDKEGEKYLEGIFWGDWEEE